MDPAVLFAVLVLVNLLASASFDLSKSWMRYLIFLVALISAAIASLQFNLLLLPSFFLLIIQGRVLQPRYGLKRLKKRLVASLAYLLATTVWLAIIDLIIGWSEWWSWPLVIAVIFLAISARALVLVINRTRVNQTVNDPKNWPAVTVAIPARNETKALADNLRSLLASDYPRLEILVLDDCSQDSTPEIIKSFANDGIRFIQGHEPSASWIGKNHALQLLLEEASGEYILFAGVDIRFSPKSISRLVGLLNHNQAELMSVMPYRRHLDLIPNLARPLRYFWQLAFSSWPMMNSVWVARRQWLIEQKGFQAYKHSIWPERKIAHNARVGGAYRFLVSDPWLGISTRKRAGSLVETASRTLYPSLRREPVWVVIKSCVLASWFWLFFANDLLTLLIFVCSWLILLGAYAISENRLQPVGWLLSFVTLPLNIINEIWMGLFSMLAYEYGRVNWKGRNVCLPVMANENRDRKSQRFLFSGIGRTLK